MKLPPSFLNKWFPVLLALSAAIFLAQERKIFQSRTTPETRSQQIREKPMQEMNHDHSATSEPHEDDHSDPEKNRRMGIFHYNEGNKFLSQGKFDQAIRNYRMALHHNKNFEEAYINLSTTYLKAGNFEEARKTLNELEQLNPSHPLLYYNRACYHSLKNETEKSLEALRKAVELGYTNFKEIGKDPDLKNLRETPEFRNWWATVETRESKKS